MRIAIRCDASAEIGTGHVMRCLAVADLLRGRGRETYFICRKLAGDFITQIEQKGFVVRTIPSDSAKDTINILREAATQLLIIDHYDIDISWEKMVRPYVKKIMVLDDLADRCHDCDILLDQNYHRNLEVRYDGLVPRHCLKLLGPKYALLRKEFYEARNNLRIRDGVISRVLVFLGGGDISNETGKVLEAIKISGRSDIAFDVVISDANPHKEQLKRICAGLSNITLHYQVNNMAQLMSEADLSIGGGGSTTWERCFLGLPSLVIVLAENQRSATESLAEIGVIRNLGFFNGIHFEDIIEALEEAINNPSANKKMSTAALKLMEYVVPPQFDFLFNRETVRI